MKLTMHLFTRFSVVAATIACLLLATTAFAQPGFLPNSNGQIYSGASISGEMNATQDSLIVTVEVFYDCSVSVSFPDTLLLVSLGCVSGTIPIPNVSDEEITDICAGSLPSCTGGSSDGEQRIVYRGAVDITTYGACAPATFLVYPYNRMDAANLTNSGSPSSDRLRVFMEYYFSVDSLNTTPSFGANGHPFLCGGTTVNWGPEVAEPDGDSLVFSFRQPQTGISTPSNIGYQTGYSLSDPFGNGMTIDSETGIMSFTVPDTTDLFQVVIQVDEYDRTSGSLISRTIRDFQFETDSTCSNPPPTVATSITNVTGASLTSNYTVTLDTGVAATFDLAFTGGAGETVSITSTAATTLNGASTSTSTAGTTTTMTISWTPGSADVGTHIITLNAEDNGCDIAGKNAQKIYVIVQEASTPIQITSVTTGQETCPDSNDGTITITTTGGTGPFSFTVDGFNTGNSVTQTTGTFTDLEPDFYSVQVGDSGVSWDTAFSVTVQPSFFGFLGTPFNQLVNPSCDDACDGDARSRPNPFGNLPYTYLWSNGETGVKAFDLCGGANVVSVTDNIGCTIVDTVSLFEPPSIFVVLDSSDSVTCNGGSDGAAYVSGHGGTIASDSTTAYIIDQTEGEFEPYGVGESFNTQNYQSLNLGDDALSASINVGFNFEFFGNIQTTFQISSNGIIQFPGATSTTWQNVAIPAASNPDNWIGIWDDLNPSATTTETIETYLLGVTPNRVRVINYVDVRHWASAGALYTFQIALYETSNIIQIHTTQVPNLSEGGGNAGTTMGIENADGSFGYAVPGRNSVNWSATNDYVAFIPITQGFSYSWSSIGSGASATNLTAGIYTVTAADGTCNDTVSFTIEEPPIIGIDTTFTPPTCPGDSNGSITVLANGGNGGAYTYLWSTGSTSTTINNLPAGNYTVTVTDVLGCTEAITVTLNDPDPVVASVNVDDNVSCFGLSDGQLTASGSGGAGTYTFLWSTAATSQTITGLAAGTYTVTVTDASGCTDIDSADVTEPAVLAISIASVTNVSCVGGDDGAITANNATGGTTPYTFLWSSGGTALTESGLSAGTYTITVTDGNGCTATADTTITEPATGVSISIASAIDVSCNGGNDGSITANNATGGTTPYSFLWSSGGTSLTEGGLTAGTYTITVTDAGGCVDSADTTIVEPAVLAVDTILVTQPTCAGSSNGAITVTSTGGTTAYSYLWNTGDTTAAVTGLTAGNYTVTVTDANGCTDNISVTLNNGPSITATITEDSPIDCNGNNSGQLTASGSNGTAPYTFVWSTTSTSATINNLFAGTYTVTVTDNNGCQDSTSAILVDPAALIASIIDSNDVGCLGGNDGDATAQGSGGTAPYSFLWSNGDTTALTSNLTAGSYTVTVTDANGCTDNASVTIDQPATGITATVTGTNVTCFGLTNGTASAAGSGGTTPYTFVWSTGSTSQNLTGLGAGTYTATVTDASGCTGVDSVTITAPAFPVIAVTSTDSVSCFGANDGQIQAFLINGTNPLSYNWSTGDTTQLVTGLTAGTYTVTVTDDNGCFDTQTDIIAGPAAISLTMDSINPSCAGNNDGSAWVSASGGTGGYDYLWNTTSTADSISGLGTATYVVTVTDANGCEGIDSVTLDNGTGIQAILTLVNNPSCAGTTTGSIAANVTNASTPFSVSYLWNTGSTSNLQFSVGAGTYTVTVTDNNTGCQDDTTITLVDPPALSVSIIDSLNPTCGNTDGELEALGTGGTGAISYLWNTGDTTALITGLGGGTFTVVVTDANGCQDSVTTALIAPTGFTATGAELASETCVGNDGQATVTMAGGTTPFTFVWSNGDTTQTITGLAANTYNVTVTDASGCTDTAVAIVADSCTCNWTANGVLINDLVCNGDSSGNATVSHAGAAAPVTYLWSDGSTNDSLVGVPAGTYTVTVTDNDGCIDTSEVVIDEPTLLEITSFSNITQPTCDDDCDGAATVNATGGTGTLTYAWSSGGTSTAVTGLCGGGHYVTVTDASGCEANDLIALVERPALFAQVDSTDSVTCPGNNDGAAFLSAHGGFAASDSTTEYVIDQSEGTFEPYPTGRPWNALNYKTFSLNDDATSDTINIFGGDDFEFFGVNHTHFIMNSQGFITFDLSNPNSGQVNGQFSNSTAIPSAAAGTPKDFIAAYWEDLDPSVGSTILETYLIGIAPNRVRVVNYIEIDHFSGTTGSGDISTFQIVLNETSNIIQIHSDSLNSDGGTHVQGIENFAGTNAYAVPGRNNTNFSVSDDYVAFIPTTQDFTYTWSSIGSSASDTTLTAGSYTVTVSDGTCEDTVQFDIFQPANGLSVGMSATTSFCFVCTGTATANVSNGTGPFTYAWSNTTTNNSTVTSDTITSLCSGPYSVTVTDADGCVDSNSVVVNDLFAPAVTASSTDASCANSCDGVVTASFNCFTCGPAEWFNYPDTTTVIGTGDTLTGRCAGIYLVRITTGFGCSNFDTIEVDAPSPLVLVMDSTDAACTGSPTGSAGVTVSGGTTTYTYLWNTGGTNDTIDNKVAGTYTVTVTDGNGCTDSAEVIINQGTDLIASATLINDVTCNGGADGSAVATQTGGAAPFTYAWSNTSTNDTLFNVSAGTYIVTITGNNGCEDTASVVIDEPDTIGFAFTETPISCGGPGNDGAIALVASGGTPGYTYLWSTGGTGTSITGLTSGTYCVTVTDAAGCEDSACYVLSPPGAFSVAIVDSADVLCFGDATGFAVVQVQSGGSGNYSYAWDNAATTDTVNNLDAGLHSVTVTDITSGCIDSATVNIGTPTALLIVIDSVDSVNCQGGNDGTASVSGSGGTIGGAGYAYLWPSGNTSQNETGLSAGTYCVTVTDGNGCEDTACVIIGEPATGISVTGVLLSNVTCNGGNDGSVTAIAAGGTAPFTLTWNGTQVADTLFNLTAGSYIVVANDNGACTATDTVVVTEPTAITASFNNVQDPSCPGDTNGQATISVSGGTPGYTYFWPNGSTDSTATGLSDGNYCVTITDAVGCQDTFCVSITDPSGMANAFTGITNSSCTVCDGMATANPTGGNGTLYTFLWDNGQTGATNDSLCAGINTVTITDTSGCELIANVPINADSADSVVAVGIDPTCGNCDGIVFATYTCTVAPCTVEWTNLGTSTVIGTTDTIDSLCAGSYSVELTNGAGCVSTAIIDLNAPALTDPNEVVTDVTCFGSCDGSIALTPTGGSGTYNYVWNTGDTTATIVGLCAAQYTVTISDGSGCDTIAMFDVGTPTEILSNEVLADASCGNLCDGQINVNPSGGAGGYTFNWSPVPNNGNGTSLADSLCGGFYFLTITDANTCTKVDTFVIFQPQPIVQDTVTVTDATCGDCDGEIDPTFSGGAGGFTFAWTDGQNTNIADSLCFGFYQVTVTDVDGCSEVFGYPVSETDGPGVNITSTNVTANGLCDGTATANITSSLGTVVFVWSNGDTVQTADSLCAGSYIVTVTDTNGCSTVDTITITEPDTMGLDFTITEITCAGTGCDGEILATVNGGVGPYTYAWSNGDTTALITGLCSGTYTLTVSDFNGQIIVDSIQLGDPTPFVITSVVSDVSCPGDCDGSIDLTIVGSGAPITILWNTGDTTAMIMDLCPGTYSVTISDTSGCMDSLEIDIMEPSALAITVDSLTLPDCQVNNGMIAVTASGGTGSTYNYLWLDVAGTPLVPTQATSMATNLGAGIYNVAVVDSNGCTDTFNVILNNANAPVITLNDLQDASCFGECDGSIDVGITGGTTPYNILWSTGDTTAFIDSLCAGTDTIVVVDSNLCISFDIYSIEQPDQIQVRAAQVVGVTCGADCDGSISIDSIIGGTTPYTFAWSTGATTDSIGSLCAGTYGLTITDVNGCSFDTNINVGGPAPMILTLDSLGDATCTNTGDGFINVSMAGGTAPYTYEWIYDGTDTVTTQDIQGALAGTYVLNVYDVNGCVVSDTFEVTAAFFVDVTAQDDLEVCPFSTDVKLTGTQTGAASTRWLFTNGIVAGNGNNLTVNTSTDTSMYIFEGINGVCVDRDTVRVIWTPGPGLDAGPDKFIEPGESTTIGGAPTANAGVDVLWTPAQDISSVEDENPTVNPLETIVYYVSATDADGCFGLDSVTVTVEEVVDPVGGFSPNGDGVNDGFVIDRIEDYPNAVVQIFNRWGNLIFESQAGYPTPWNGTYKGKSLPVGTYYYVIDLNDPEISRLITGPVTILK